MLRLRTGRTAEEVGWALGVSRSAVLHWETGERTPKARHLKGFREFCRKALARK